ncbi:MAG: porphobilinogen synthase [Phycisphaerales bacterium]|nr:porphobilinogen synthase [Phycisphaerales bacterium]
MKPIARRMRRMRRSEAIRAMMRETQLSAADFIYPLFVAEVGSDAGPVASMPGVERHSLESLPRELEEVSGLGIPSVMLFGIPVHKDSAGSQAYAESGVICQAIRRVKETWSDLVVVADVCLCEYTDHGHCGVVRGETIENDETLDVLARTATAYATAGADVVAPSGMMDGMVSAIRQALDESSFQDVGILSYAVKYASAFYGPFRDAAACAPKFGDRRTHQMDPANANEALAEVDLDITEGADMVMVKPAMPYLDVVRRLRERYPAVPLAAYQVSGEYSMIKAAAAQGWLDERKVAMESLLAIKRAGADIIISYFAKEAVRWLHGTD